MPAQKTHADAIRFKLTGASSHDAVQADPDLALGDHLAADLIQALGYTTADPSSILSIITIDDLPGENGLGTGVLRAETADTLSWTPPGGSAGAIVSIANGETKIIEGADINKHIVVTRTSASSMTVDDVTLTITDVLNNIMGATDITPAEASAGKTVYRALGLENVSGADVLNIKAYVKTLGTQLLSGTTQLGGTGTGTIEVASGTFADWPDVGFCRIETTAGVLIEIVYYTSRTATVLSITDGTNHRGLLGTSTGGTFLATDKIYPVPGIRIEHEAPASQPSGKFTGALADEEDSTNLLSSFTWNSSIIAAEGESVGTLQTLEIAAIWVERTTVIGAIADANVLNVIGLDFDAA